MRRTVLTGLVHAILMAVSATNALAQIDWDGGDGAWNDGTWNGDLFADEEKAEENHALAEKCKDNLAPVTFLMLQGSKDDDKSRSPLLRKACEWSKPWPLRKQRFNASRESRRRVARE